MTTIQEQIDWLEAQIRHMKRSLPEGVQAGRIDQATADEKMTCAFAAMATLLNVRALFRGDDARFNVPFVGVEHIKRLALCSVMMKEQVSDCPFPWHSEAYRIFAAEFVRLEEEEQQKAKAA